MRRELDRETAIKLAGIEAVEAVEAQNCDYTNRPNEVGFVEFAASVKFIDRYVREEELDDSDSLDFVDWEIHSYEIW